ncbi:hypothetical protein HUG10_19870 (plasmid) [Halorarum halophilum]|uniref:Uncharacterized protein n=1 Tax=Halorarum halophilum TaxID=2743090 RepID=A0A7D5GIE6_9EURY|nr:hypothetical protein [Halobaculum halophilum]QLG29870.1 hypothetical protein HUG10_19870 [Halobaculum halophilum]
MSTNVRIGLVAVMLIVASGAFAASAYTSGSVERSANVNVVNDDTGLIALQDGTSGDLVFQNATGALAIDFTAGGAGGANTAAHYELGDPANANTSYAFNLTNLDAESHDFTVAYSGSDGQDTDANIEFQVYDSTGTLVDTANEEGTSASLSGVASGETLYVVIVVDTHGLDSTADLSGTLTISA